MRNAMISAVLRNRQGSLGFDKGQSIGRLSATGKVLVVRVNVDY